MQPAEARPLSDCLILIVLDYPLPRARVARQMPLRQVLSHMRIVTTVLERMVQKRLLTLIIPAQRLTRVTCLPVFPLGVLALHHLGLYSRNVLEIPARVSLVFNGLLANQILGMIRNFDIMSHLGLSL